MLKLPEYARRMGITRAHAHKLWQEGRLPHKAEQIGPRTILVDVPPDFGLNKPTGRTIIYSRVSSAARKDALIEQKHRIMDYCLENKIKIDESIEEIGSGMNPNRKKLNNILKDSTVEHIIIEHRERLARFNYELIENALKGRNCKITVINNNEIEDDLIRDVTEILTSLCARIYGQRGAKIKAQKILKEVSKNDNTENKP